MPFLDLKYHFWFGPLSGLNLDLNLTPPPKASTCRKLLLSLAFFPFSLSPDFPLFQIQILLHLCRRQIQFYAKKSCFLHHIGRTKEHGRLDYDLPAAIWLIWTCVPKGKLVNWDLQSFNIVCFVERQVQFMASCLRLHISSIKNHTANKQMQQP